MTRHFPASFCLLLLVVGCASPPTALYSQEPGPGPVSPAPVAESSPSTWGIGAVLRPIRPEDSALFEQALALPAEQRDRVHLVIINGLDPLYASNLNGLAAYYRSIGFANCTCWQLLSTGKARRHIESVRRCDPDARIILVGYSLGANCVRSLAHQLQRDGVNIDCLVYLGGDTVFNTPTSRPANVGRIVNITGHGMIFLGRNIYFKGDDIDGAVNQRLAARHITLPGQSDTIRRIGTELISLAGSPTPAESRAELPAAPVPAIPVANPHPPIE